MMSPLSLRTTSIISIALLISPQAAFAQTPGTISGAVFFNSQTNAFTYTAGPVTAGSVAFGTYTDMNGTESNFGQLSITTQCCANDTVQMFAAGYLEAALTHPRIWSHANNTLAWISSQFKGGVIPPVVKTFFTTQDAWTRAQIASNTSAYWKGMSAILSQFDGMVAGYTALAPSDQTLSLFDLQSVGAIGDYLDLIVALTDEGPNYDNMTDSELMATVRKNNHCSALVKVTGDFSELFFSHVAWFIFQSTTRIFKHYNFIGLTQPEIAGRQMSFSSYPAYLSSLDDFYAIWDSGIAVLETTNNVFNKSLYTAVVPQSLFAWHRVRLANLLSHTPPEWASTFSEHNSGTYNNQYPVINVGAFVPGSALPPDLLWIVEQVPGLVVSGDATEILALGHFPSYNVPFWREIYDISGYKEQISKRRKAGEPLGELSGLDWQLAPRAKIFRRDAGKVTDMPSFLSLMRSNDYKNDPYAAGSPWNAICSRGDLAGSPDGCLDGKASMASMWASKTALAINGPTTGSAFAHGPLPPFAWSEFPNTPHQGLPPVYDFDFEEMKSSAW
jgi:hypothetical protein